MGLVGVVSGDPLDVRVRPANGAGWGCLVQDAAQTWTLSACRGGGGSPPTEGRLTSPGGGPANHGGLMGWAKRCEPKRRQRCRGVLGSACFGEIDNRPLTRVRSVKTSQRRAPPRYPEYEPHRVLSAPNRPPRRSHALLPHAREVRHAGLLFAALAALRSAVAHARRGRSSIPVRARRVGWLPRRDGGSRRPVGVGLLSLPADSRTDEAVGTVLIRAADVARRVWRWHATWLRSVA